MNIAICVVWYNPSTENIKKIVSLGKVYNKVFVIDNSNNKHDIEQRNNIVYFWNGKNNGLSYSYNLALQKSLENKIDYLCVLDQDSDFLVNDINVMNSFIYEHLELLKNIAMIVPKIHYQHCDENVRVDEREFEQVEWAISSGSYHNVRLLKDNQIAYDENYFIDRCDADICMQIRRKKLEILQCNRAVLHQELGEANGHRHTSHTPLRHYYIFRNRLYYNKKYYSLLKKFILDIFQSIKHVSLILLFEDEKITKLSYCAKGYKDYRMSRMGKFIA